MLCLINSTNISNNFDIDKIFIKHMQAFTDLLYFEPKIQVSDWPRVIEALKVVYPNIRWRSGGKLDIFTAVPCNGLIVTSANSMYPGKPLLSWGVWANKENFVEHALGINWKYGEVKDGWLHLGFKQEFDFDSLTESKLIRRIIKESIDEFDWVDYNPSLYDLISSLFKHQHPEYWLEKDFDYENITIADKTGNYIILDESEFTIENIRETLYDNIINLEKDHGRKAFGVRAEYIQLAKALEPIIGPINID